MAWEASSSGKHRVIDCWMRSHKNCEGPERGETQRPLYVLPRSLELILRAVAVLEEFRVGHNMVLLVSFENHSGRHLRQGCQTVILRPLPVFAKDVLLEHSPMFMYCLWLLLCYSGTDSSWIRDCMASKAWTIYCRALSRKSLSTFDLGDEINAEGSNREAMAKVKS